MALLSKIDTVEYFKEIPFYNKPIKKPNVESIKKH